MTKEEALLYLPLQDADLEDVYETQVFELQQFFLRQVPVSRLYRSKKQSMARMQEAFEVLGGLVSQKSLDIPALRTTDSASLLEHVRVYQENLSQLKAAVMRSTSFPQLEILSETLLENMRSYAHALAVDGGQQVRVTQAGDELEILVALKQLEAEDKATKAGILELEEDNPVRREANRLSLWLKMEKDD